MKITAESKRAQRLLTALGLVVAMVLAQTGQAFAAQIPDPTSSLYLQTSGPDAGLSIGDYYTSPAGAATDHLFTLFVPSNWPAGTPVTVALYDPELAGPNPSSPSAADEVRGAADTASFRLEDPSGDTVATADYTGAATNGTWVELATFDPGATGTGTYDIHVSVSDDDDNSWRIDASHDPDCAVGGPGTCASADLQNGNESDTAPSGSSALGLAVVRTSYQHAGSGQVCQDHVFRVNSSTPRPLRAHNFDMDNNGSVTYTTPAGETVPGTVSGNAVWNGSTNTDRVGDVLPDIDGWWSAEICISSNNQYVFEAPSAGPSFPVPQPTPRLEIAKDDGVTEARVGDELTYTITVSNVSDEDSYPGDAHEITITDSLPVGAAFLSCTTAAGVSCVESAGVVTITSDSALAPGASISAEVTVSVGVDVDVVLSNTATVSYEDHLGSTFADEEATDSNDVEFEPVLVVTADAPAEVLRGDSITATYAVSHAPGSDGSPVSSAVFTCDVCTSLSLVGGDDDSDGILDSTEVWTYSGQIDTTGGDPDPLTATAGVSGSDKNSEVVEASVSHDIDLIEPGSIAGTVYEDLDGDGTRDAGEPGIDDAPVNLSGSSGLIDTTDPTDGSYSFTGLAPADYTIGVDGDALSPGLVPTSTEQQTVALPEGTAVTSVDFGFAFPVTISGTVFVDDGTNPAEGYSGLTVTLSDGDDAVVDTTTTAEDGTYSFMALPSDYTVAVTGGIPLGWALTTPADIHVGPLSSSDASTGHDFGIFNTPPEVSDVVQEVQVGDTPESLIASDGEGMEVTFELADGSLPSGLSLNADGTWGGEVMESGVFALTVQACDTGDPEACNSFSVQLTVPQPEVAAVEVETLPFTGMDTGRLLAAGILLLASGGVAVGFARTDEDSSAG